MDDILSWQTRWQIRHLKRKNIVDDKEPARREREREHVNNGVQSEVLRYRIMMLYDAANRKYNSRSLGLSGTFISFRQMRDKNGKCDATTRLTKLYYMLLI